MKKFALLAMLTAGTLSAQNLTLSPEQKAMAQSGNDFSFRFLQQIDKIEEGDWFVSPMSLQFLLGVILNGAQKETAAEIARTLGFEAGELEAINDYNRSMLRLLPKLDPATQLSIGSAVFVNAPYPLLKSYKKQVEKYYDAEVRNLDFQAEEASTKAINSWCSKQTQGLIPSVIDKVDPAIFAYLLNAIYFKGTWADKFNERATEDRPFHRADGSEKQVKMMEQERKFYYSANDDFKMVRLPYGNSSFQMIALLPQEGRTTADVLAALDAESWQTLRKRMDYVKVNLWLPRFETKYHIRLNDILTNMGMARSFKPGANFKSMSLFADYLDFVQQDAIIKVDEKGSEAAAVTTAGVALATAVAVQPPVYEFHADKPFLYLIVESTTGSVLFAGEYTGK